MAAIEVTINPLSSLYADLEKILKSLVIKYSYNAEMFENLETRKYSDEYLDALQGLDNYFTHTYTTEDMVEAVKEINPAFIVTDEVQSLFVKWVHHPEQVTKRFQQVLLNLRRKHIIETYEEPNDYYRMLNGLPNIDDKEFFYINDEFIEKYQLQELHLEHYGIDPELPIHKIEDTMGSRYINILEALGAFDALRKDYPEKKYLEFLGPNRISVKDARKAKNFEILRITTDVRAITLEVFYQTYDSCREYFVNTVYIPAHRQSIAYYDNFIALCIMSMTFQQVFARTIQYAIDREFFDDYMVQLLYSVYGLPYESRLPYEVQRRIVKNLNVLILNKATNKVIYDVAYLLGFHKITINKYYLVKERKFDSRGNLVYEMQPTYDDFGEVNGEEYDLEKMFDVYFQKVSLDSNNIYKAITDKSNYVDYHSLTMDDPLWWEDNDLFVEKYSDFYNFVETKYLGITISYKLSEMVFANIILFHLVFDLKDVIDDIKIELPKISETASVNLFDAIVAMCAMICKKYGIKGEILTDISKILHVLDENDKFANPDVCADTLGFNFQAVSNEPIDISNCGHKNCSYYDGSHVDENGAPSFCSKGEESPCKGMTHLDYTTKDVRKYLDFEEELIFDSYLDELKVGGKTMEEQIDAFNGLYKDVQSMFYFISNKLSYTDDIEEYYAYRNLYRALYIMKEEDQMFKKGFTEDSPVADTYLDYLESMQPDIADFIKQSDEVALYTAIDHVISQIELVLGNIDTLHLVNDGTSVLQEYLIKLIRFFKSYTTDLISLGTIYIFDFKPDNMLRLIDKVGKINKSIITDEKTMHLGYSDYMQAKTTITYPEKTMRFHDTALTVHPTV